MKIDEAERIIAEWSDLKVEDAEKVRINERGASHLPRVGWLVYRHESSCDPIPRQVRHYLRPWNPATDANLWFGEDEIWAKALDVFDPAQIAEIVCDQVYGRDCWKWDFTESPWALLSLIRLDPEDATLALAAAIKEANDED